ncbi:MAG: DUF2752 domain-containing protein [Clostridia bacterium]|nr:DUF2752 domain-containing protein [Clostridia bacterium]
MRPIAHWRQKLAGLAALAAIVAVMYLLQAGCIIQRLTGVPCPGCGMTRAVLALLAGDVPGALRHHGMVWSLPVLLAMYLWEGRLFRRRWINGALMALLVAGFAANWAVHLAGWL